MLEELKRNLDGIALLVAGLLLATFYYGAWRNPVNDFLVWVPAGYAVFALLTNARWLSEGDRSGKRDMLYVAIAILVGSILG